MIRFLEKLLNPQPPLVIPSIQFESSQLEKIQVEGCTDYDVIVVEKWVLEVDGKKFQLTYKDHPNGQLAELDGTSVPAQLALACFDSFFDQGNLQKAQNLLSELKRYQ